MRHNFLKLIKTFVKHILTIYQVLLLQLIILDNLAFRNLLLQQQNMIEKCTDNECCLT